MKKLFVDTNIVIDLLSRREPFFEEAAILFSLADKKQVELSISSLTIANTSYTLLRQMDSSKTKSILRKLKLILEILPLDDKVVGLALNDDTFTDFEGGLQYFTAVENQQEVIITRNLKDFKNSIIPTMTAKQFIETLA
ncbi:type II toxin-antitoxin system VapC family toxin [Acidiluteibacter ferrifornacis]|uniref:PIN domain-containing protein n=1 Tax=Acidiluteibacter ferrifornacis TaxID=2692424 RepID=A0A6N9NLP6_9FLAO|nr:PIN domain-containing protein [Acidiluteibacter ferrifornacis]NBG65495.1 PIN domain-containing protein [Acidiluteibacter ferrifornacis]